MNEFKNLKKSFLDSLLNYEQKGMLELSLKITFQPLGCVKSKNCYFWQIFFFKKIKINIHYYSHEDLKKLTWKGKNHIF